MDKKSQQSRKNYYEKNREKIGKNCMKKIKMEKKCWKKQVKIRFYLVKSMFWRYNNPGLPPDF